MKKNLIGFVTYVAETKDWIKEAQLQLTLDGNEGNVFRLSRPDCVCETAGISTCVVSGRLFQEKSWLVDGGPFIFVRPVNNDFNVVFEPLDGCQSNWIGVISTKYENIHRFIDGDVLG